MLGKGCGAVREGAGTCCSSVLSCSRTRPSSGGVTRLSLCCWAACSKPAEPPGAGSAASQWSPARGEESREGKDSLVTKSVLQETVSYGLVFRLGWQKLVGPS